MRFLDAGREVEAWLLAHREGFARFLGVRAALIPEDVESLPDPKRFLINLAGQSRYRNLREAIVPRSGSTARVGPDYNGQLISFVKKNWQIQVATQSSPSLKRTVEVLTVFKPTWSNLANQL